MGYANSPLGYANPDAVTQIANGLSTSTFAYDACGNLVQKTTDRRTTNAGREVAAVPRSTAL